MFQKLRTEMRTLRDAEPGTRFELGHERTRVDNRVLRLGLVFLGLALMVTAAATFWLPGPNFVLVFAGLVLVGGQSETVAKWMDSGEVVARRWHDEHWEPYPHKRAVKLVGALVVAVGGCVLAYYAYQFDLLPGWVRGPVDDVLDALGR